MMNKLRSFSITPRRIFAGLHSALNAEIYRDTAPVLAYLAVVAFVVGIFAPSFTMIPKFGDGFFERLVRLFVSSDLEPRQFSLVGGIWHLFQEGELFIGGLILLFSVVFPAIKLAAILMVVHGSPAVSVRHMKIMEKLGKWSMLDVFVIASLVVCFKGFPGGTHIQVQWGIYLFALSVLLSMLATQAVKHKRSIPV
jgi:paraquat-inducible protein A